METIIISWQNGISIFSVNGNNRFMNVSPLRFPETN
jgi:hypothetical protein